MNGVLSVSERRSICLWTAFYLSMNGVLSFYERRSIFLWTAADCPVIKLTMARASRVASASAAMARCSCTGSRTSFLKQKLQLITLHSKTPIRVYGVHTLLHYKGTEYLRCYITKIRCTYAVTLQRYGVHTLLHYKGTEYIRSYITKVRSTYAVTLQRYGVHTLSRYKGTVYIRCYIIKSDIAFSSWMKKWEHINWYSATLLRSHTEDINNSYNSIRSTLMPQASVDSKRVDWKAE